MPLIAYIGAHGANDYPLHFSFFRELEARGLLDRFDFVVDTFRDPIYAKRLALRFPQLMLGYDLGLPRKMIEQLKTTLGKGYRWLALLDRKVDAVCEAPGGRLTSAYSGKLSHWWLYPHARRRAVFFHSFERELLDSPKVRRSIAETDVFVARTNESAANARASGCPHVVEASDIVFNSEPTSTPFYVPGVAAALRIPNRHVPAGYLETIRDLLDSFEADQSRLYDLVRIEEPIGSEMYARDYVNGTSHHVRLYADDAMYYPFRAQRDVVISFRLHTTIIALIHGNRKLFQAQVESGTTKIRQFAEDLGLSHLRIHGPNDLSVESIRGFIKSGEPLPETEARSAIATARQRNEAGLQAVEEWLESVAGGP